MPRALVALALVLIVLPSAALADIAPSPRERIHPTLLLEGAHATTRDAPDEDMRRVQDQVVAALQRNGPRLQQCTAGIDLREDPIRGPRSRRIVGRLRFERSTRPTGVTVSRPAGIPRAAAACVQEIAESIAINPAPRGTVAIRFVYYVAS